METTYTIYRPDAEPERGSIDWPEDPGFLLINTLVMPIIGCEWIEHVTVLHNGSRHDMFVDETGLLKSPNLARNEAATAIYRAATLRRHPHTPLRTLPFIAGVAVLFDRRVWF